MSGSVRPDHILLLNNNKNNILKFEGVDVINSEYNTRSRGKYPIALSDVADYYLFLDDDTSVGYRTLEFLLSTANENSCHAPYGRFIGRDECVFSDKIERETPVDYVLAVGLFVSFKCIARMLLSETRVRVPTKWKHEAEDILIGITNKPTILPMRGDQNFVHLSWGTQAMDWGSDGLTEGKQEYYNMRYAFTDEAIKILDSHPLPEY
jgi:hypothetical protein